MKKSLLIGNWILLIDKILTTMLPIVFLCLIEVFWLTFEGPLDTCRYELWRLLQYTLVGYVHCSPHDWCISLARELGIEIATCVLTQNYQKHLIKDTIGHFIDKLAIHAPSITKRYWPKWMLNEVESKNKLLFIVQILFLN